MLPRGKQRARTEEDRAARREALIAAARAALDARAFDDITMNELAEAASISKGAAYLYVRTKEELFLLLLMRELESWFAGLERAIARRDRDPAAQLARAIARSLAREQRLLSLLSLLHGRLEPHVETETLRAFKLFLRDHLARVGAMIDEKLAAPPDLGAELLLRTHALAIGLGQMAAPPANVERVLDADASLHPLRIDFEPAMAKALTDLLRGRLAMTSRSP